MILGVHDDENCTSVPMVDRVAARMVINYCLDKGWTLENIDTKSAFLHEDHLYHKPVYIREPADGTYKHGKTMGIQKWNFHGSPSGTYYYLQDLLKHLRKIKAVLNEAEACLLRIPMPSSVLIAAIAADAFLVALVTSSPMKEFSDALSTKYRIKRL